MTLSAIDAKLRKVDNLDRTMEQMMRRIDAIDSRLVDSAARSDAILTQLKSVDGRLTQISSQQRSAGAVDNVLEPRILALDEKVSVIGSKLNVLAYQLDSNSLLWNNNNETSDGFATAGSETSRAYTAVPPPANGVKPPPDAWAVNEEVDSIRTAMTSMDRHLKILIELFSEQMDKMMGMVNDVRGALVSHDHSLTSTTTTASPSSTEASYNTSGRISSSKLDALFQKMTPLLDVSEKMDEVWNVLVGTKSSVDTLVPTSEALLWQTQRQERAISDIHTDLNVKTKQIIENLNLVERQLLQHQQQVQQPQVQQREISGGNKPRSTKPAEATAAAAEASAAHKASESQVHVTYKQGTEGLPNRSSTLIRAQELSPGPATSTTKSSPVPVVTSPAPAPVIPPADGTILTLPTDIMDSEFLHDDPLAAVFKKTNSSRPVNASSSTTTSTTTTTTSSSVSSSSATSGSASNGTATSTVRSVHIPPAGPTERSRIPTNSAVIFPSVKNKPGFNNSTFFYDYTTPQNIRVSDFCCRQLA